MINGPWSQEFSGSQVLDLGFLPLAFNIILIVASRFLHPYSSDGKTSRLMVKRFSTVRDAQKGSQSYRKKRRGSREIEVTRRRRGGIKGGKSSLASNQIPICSQQSGRLREVHKFHREEKREEGDRGNQEEMRGSQKERDQSSL